MIIQKKSAAQFIGHHRHIFHELPAFLLTQYLDIMLVKFFDAFPDLGMQRFTACGGIYLCDFARHTAAE